MKRISLLLSVLLFTGSTIWAQAPIFEFEHFQLENGLTVVLVEDQQAPQVSFQLYVDRPIINEAGYAGTGHLMGQLLSAGTLRRTKAEIDEIVETAGAKLRTNSHGAIISGAKDQAETLMDVLADCTRNAIFPEDEFLEAVKLNQSALVAQQEDPEAIAASVANQLRYGANHPYGERMTAKTLSNIPLSACRNFQSLAVHHNSVAGFEPSHAVADLRDLTGAVSAEDQGRRKFPLQPPAAVSGVEVQAVQRRGPDPDLDLACLHLRLRALAEGQYLRAAVGFNIDCLHGRVLLGASRQLPDISRQSF